VHVKFHVRRKDPIRSDFSPSFDRDDLCDILVYYEQPNDDKES